MGSDAIGSGSNVHGFSHGAGARAPPPPPPLLPPPPLPPPPPPPLKESLLRRDDHLARGADTSAGLCGRVQAAGCSQEELSTLRLWGGGSATLPVAHGGSSGARAARVLVPPFPRQRLLHHQRGAFGCSARRVALEALSSNARPPGVAPLLQMGTRAWRQ